ncbi:MAG TPA: hypothetical protein VFG68_19880 [Fimbriiglobus sp.]|nr:hypothetical protein [Fimbriiglobus sp.]
MTGEQPTASQEPDHFFLGKVGDRLPDGGPRYRETPPDPTAVPIAEPFNAVTASFFLLIVLFWAWRLWGRFARYPFLTACLPILLAGGIGGTLYHAFRTRRAWFLLDVIPIQVLGLATAVYLTVRLARSMGVWRVAGTAVGLLALGAVLNIVLFNLLQGVSPNLPVNLAYASLALIVVMPLAVVLVRTRFRHVGWVATALACFAVGWFCRLVDGGTYDPLRMGTHWLWHTFGALTTLAITEYFYLLEVERVDDTDEEAPV